MPVHDQNFFSGERPYPSASGTVGEDGFTGYSLTGAGRGRVPRVRVMGRKEPSMSSLIRRGKGDDVSRFGRLDRIFEEWMRSMPLRRPFGFGFDWPGEDIIRVDEYRDGNTQVIRAELPGIDPDKDVELTVTDGILRIKAERRVEEKTEDKGYLRHELHYGSLSRSLPLPEGASESDITASYTNGILEVRVPVPERPVGAQPTKIAITKRS
jgi:HSP20 family protein